MKIIYDPQTDSLTLILREMAVKESDEIREGLIVDYGEDNRVVAIEMLDASENISDSPRSMLFYIFPATISRRPYRPGLQVSGSGQDSLS